MKTVLAALLAVSLVLPTSDVFAAEKMGQLQLLQAQQAQPDKPNMTRRYRAKHRAISRTRTYRASRGYRTTRGYRTSRVRAYRTQRCDPFMRNVFGICTY